MSQWFKLMWVTAGGTGLLPKAPGTWGSLKPVIVVLIWGHFGLPSIWLIGLLVAIIIAASISTVALAPWYTKHFERHDPPQVVSDEVAGQSIALLGMAWLQAGIDVPVVKWITLVLLAFLLFRVFDIWKPSIINHAQKLPQGWGVLMDDVLAGIAASAIVLINAVIS